MPGLILPLWIVQVLELAAQSYDLQYGLPVALLIAFDVPADLVCYEVSLPVRQGPIGGPVVSGHPGGGAVKQGAASDSHDQIFKSKQKPRSF